MRAIPIESFLVDGLAPTAPLGFNTTRIAIDAVPREFDLSDGWTAILYSPTGVARAWIDAVPDELVVTSDDEFTSHPSADGLARAPARLVIRHAGAVLGAVPLVIGVTGTLYAPAAMLEIVLLSWEIRAGAMRGGVPRSARVELAWRSRTIARGNDAPRG